MFFKPALDVEVILVPGVTVAAVVFADCSPLPLTKIGAPFLPVEQLLMDFLQAAMFLRHLWHGNLPSG